MIIEPAVEADLPGIFALEREFPDRERWSERLWADELAAADRLVLAAFPDDLDEDCAPVVGAATFQVVGETADLHRVVVAESQRRRGLARVLLATGVSWASARGATRMLLEVRHDNPAVAFYRANGFAVVGERRNYYGPGAHALVMELPLAGLEPDAVGLSGMEVAR